MLVLFDQSVMAQVCPSPVPTEYQHVQPGSIVAAYFGNWDVYGGNHYPISKIAEVAPQLTHLIYGFMKPDDVTGTCKPHDLWADVGGYEGYQSKIGGNFAQLLELKQKFPHLKIMLSVGGGTYNKNFISIAKDKDKLLRFAQSCVDMLDFYDHPFLMDGAYKRKNHLTYQGLFDGLDIDWEWDVKTLTPEYAERFSEFIHELKRLLVMRKQQSGQEGLLTVALQVMPEVYQNLGLAKFMDQVDWFNIMAYDFFGSHSATVGLNAPICGSWSLYSIDGAIDRIIKEQLSPEKMVLGLPLYGYVYENTNGYKAIIDKKNNTGKAKALSYHIIKSRYLDNADCKTAWNDFERASSLYCQKEKLFVSYDNKQSMLEKVDFAHHKRMQGVVLWRLSGDDPEHTIVRAVSRAVAKL